MGNCLKRHERQQIPLENPQNIFVDREMHDTRKMGITFSISKSNEKMGIDSEISGKMNHDIVETFGEPKVFDIPSIQEVMQDNAVT